ncbi:MAG TPA: GMC family oxidoreductase N-terminal domain-containing protein [Dongiaceae bacterium]|nr:GMC family oxidoreductase N-terminal domain-containing protein [Dongiaceae bacterium]
MNAHADGTETCFDERVRQNQQRQLANLKSTYDFIVCGSGSSGSVVARRLAENPLVSVLLLEAGGADDHPAVRDAARWTENLGSDRDWGFATRPNPHLNGRALTWSMGKVLGGGSSINVMVWSRGHKNDWDGFATETGDARWSYESILDIYRRIEDWQGVPDPRRRGMGGLVFTQTAQSPIAVAMLEAAGSVGIPAFADQNGIMMEGVGGAALANFRIRDGKRLSIFRTYVRPHMDRPNLTVMTGALMTKIMLDGKRAAGVEVSLAGGRPRRFDVGHELILSLGAIHTPKVLMRSGIGDAAQLRSFNIDVAQHLPGVGKNLQEHLLLAGCVWEYARPEQLSGCGAAATFFWKSDERLETPDLQSFLVEGAFLSPKLQHGNQAEACWSITPGVVRPHSRGEIRLTGANPSDPVDIDTGILSDPADLKAAMACVRLCREIGNARAFDSLRKGEIVPGNLRGAALENFVRNATVPFWHFSCTAKMGRDEMSVVDAELCVHGIERLRIADASVMPQIVTGNTMAPCVIIGERAAALIRDRHGL